MPRFFLSKIRSRKGFTLTEMVLACAIAAVLVAAGVFYSDHLLEDANISKAKTDMQAIALAAAKYRADMGPNSLNDIKDSTTTWCTELKKTKTSPDGESVGPWLGMCPNAPHAGGSYKVVKLNDYTPDVYYTYGSKTLKLSEMK